MLYLYDVWVNWFEGEEEGYNVCDYHEWRKKDKIEILEQVPVLYISNQLFYTIENSLSDIPTPLLEKIYKRAYMRKGHTREVLEYACIVTDGKGILAFDTLGYHIPIRKSRLIPRQEQQIFELCKKSKRYSFPFTPKQIEQEDSIMSINRKYMYGLTRRERQLKKLLMIAMEQLKTTNNRNEILYWLSEWDENKKGTYDAYRLSIQELWQLLYEDIKIGWSEAHEKLCAQLVKGNRFLERFWEMEQVENKKKSH